MESDFPQVVSWQIPVERKSREKKRLAFEFVPYILSTVMES